MPLLSQNELDQLRVDLSDLLPDTCVILHPTFTQDNGDQTIAWGTAVASALCRFDPDTSPITDTLADREAMLSRFIVTMEYNVNVNAGDRLVFSSNTYTITSLYGEHSLRGVKRLKTSLIRG